MNEAVKQMMRVNRCVKLKDHEYVFLKEGAQPHSFVYECIHCHEWYVTKKPLCPVANCKETHVIDWSGFTVNSTLQGEEL